MKKEIFKPIQLLDLEESCMVIVDAFDKANDQDRSREYRAYHLKNAESLSKNLLRDFRFYLDKYEIGGVIPYDLELPQ